MTNWVLATVEFPKDMTGYVFNDESIWFLDEYDNYGYWYDGNSTYGENQSISKINPLYIIDKNKAYNGGCRISSYVPTTPLYNRNGYITFDINSNCLVDGYRLTKCAIPEEYDQEWAFIDTGYTTQNIDTDYEKITCDLKWSGILNDEILNEIVQKNINRQFLGIEDPNYYFSPVYFGSWYAGINFTKDDILEYSSGTDFFGDFYENNIEYENTDGTENIYVNMDSYNYVLEFTDDRINVSSIFFYNRHENKWYYYLLWSDKNGNDYYYDATDCYKNKTWLHVEYSRYQSEGTLKIGDRTFSFPVIKGAVKLGFYSFLMPVHEYYSRWGSDKRDYNLYGYTQIANLKTYVVPLDEDLGFGTPMVYVKNSNYRDNFFLSVEVENYDPNGYEILWDTGAKTVSIPCRLGEYHEVTVTNRAGSTKAWNVAGFGDARFYNYRVDICRDAIPLSDVGNTITGSTNYTIINDTEYADNCTITYHADVDSIIVNDGSSIYIDKTEDAICPLREKGYYTIIVSRYDQYASSANGVGFALSWKMKVEGDIGEWLNSSITRTYYTSALDLSSDCYGYLFCFDGYGRTGIHLSLKISHGKVYVVAKSVAQTEKWCILPTEFANGEWVECMVYMYEQNKFFFTVNGYTLLDYSENVNLESVLLFNAVMAGSSALLQNIKTPYVNIKDIKRSMQLRKDR